MAHLENLTKARCVSGSLSYLLLFHEPSESIIDPDQVNPLRPVAKEMPGTHSPHHESLRDQATLLRYEHVSPLCDRQGAARQDAVQTITVGIALLLPTVIRDRS
jgi:hypothetical protein